jgi:AraC-like DNA-binding protein
MQSDYLLGSTIFEDGHPSEVSAYVRRHVGMHSLATRDWDAHATLRHAVLGNLGLSVISYGGLATVENPVGIESFHFQMVMAGECSINVDNQQLHLLPGSAAILNPSVPSSVTYSPECIKLIINIPCSLFNAQTSGPRRSSHDQPVRFSSSPVLLDERSTTLKTVELLFLEADEAGARRAGLGNTMEILLIEKLLQSFSHNDAAGKVAGAVHNPFFDSVDAFIDKHMREDISAEQLASAHNVSLRTLYERFSLHRDLSPSAYIKLRKMRKIFQQLSSAQSGVRSVSQIAFEYGFNHMGRFSAEYRQLFGELPSETLRRTQRGA